jgi:hypothetical protein
MPPQVARRLATPTGFEKSPNSRKDHVDSASPTENAQPPESKKRFTKADGSKVAKLAILAANAVRNADLHRALELIEEIRAVGEGRGTATGARLMGCFSERDGAGPSR